jgi:hypothetical protein
MRERYEPLSGAMLAAVEENRSRTDQGHRAHSPGTPIIAPRHLHQVWADDVVPLFCRLYGDLSPNDRRRRSAQALARIRRHLTEAEFEMLRETYWETMVRYGLSATGAQVSRGSFRTSAQTYPGGARGTAVSRA